ncbi:MAG: 2,3-bisphosphoglycerate-independent phosphoglycerate mutase, partial [Alphaproteobacteria bacterium]|nr:2,3-bisphosphoglycerate-independent phosphoglycerate mutase [Alphaproteobacteria bacterium]
MTPERRPRPVVLCVLDGWGHREATDHNAIAQANTTVYDRLLESAPHALLSASSTDVGLPAGQMGNSEVGHMNIGAGRIVVQDLPRVDAAIQDGALFRAPAFAALVAA